MKSGKLTRSNKRKTFRNYLKKLFRGSNTTPSVTNHLSLEEQMEAMEKGYNQQIQNLKHACVLAQKEAYDLHVKMDKKLEEVRIAYLEFEDLRKEYQRLEEEYDRARDEALSSLGQKESMIKEYKKTISQQRGVIEKKQLYIQKLEGKVEELMVEIRGLLELEEIPIKKTSSSAVEPKLKQAPPSTSATFDTSFQLKKYLRKAENLTGMDHLGYRGSGGPRFLDLSFESFAVDRRRLFEILREETKNTLFVYSRADKKLLYVNPSVKNLLGWSSERVLKDFPHLVLSGFPEWKQTLDQVDRGREGRSSLILKTRSGASKKLHCHMGLITKGPFNNHILGILL
ncbi:MAG: hypothetical protein K940chlam9_00175 [Chlamydiae bacterium]|nr:hypothetical protein [Chlamydiota bacterium]